ncbi:MAG: GatB/YqeY domain-containing protein, partial [Gammaproteobacteria bacterium]
TVLQQYLPTPLTDTEINQLIQQAINETGAKSVQDMGRVMAMLKPKLQGRADIGAVSAKIKEHLH